MIHSDQIGELAAALCAAQGEFTAIPKGNTNPFFKSKYAALPEVVEVASPILAKHGLSVTQLLGHDEAGDTLTTCLMHKSGQFIADTMHLRPVKNDPQAQGSAVTYGRRYAYMAALGLVADEDDDGNASSGGASSRAKKPPKQKPQAAKPQAESKAPNPAENAPVEETISEETVSELRALFEKAAWDADTLKWQLVALGVEDTDDLAAAIKKLTKEQAATFKESLDLTIAEQAK